MKTVSVLFFATLRDHLGQKQLELQLADHATVANLKADLIQQQPSAQMAVENALVSINREYAFDDEFIPAGAEVALFPHVSGG